MAGACEGRVPLAERRVGSAGDGCAFPACGDDPAPRFRAVEPVPGRMLGFVSHRPGLQMTVAAAGRDQKETGDCHGWIRPQGASPRKPAPWSKADPEA